MTENDKKFKIRWEKIKSKGRIRYAFLHGGTFGFIIFIIFNLWYLKDRSFEEVFIQRDALDQMVTMVLAGIFGYGIIKWWMNEKIYKKILANENTKP